MKTEEHLSVLDYDALALYAGEYTGCHSLCDKETRWERCPMK